MVLTRHINCSAFGNHVAIHDWGLKYGDWLFKQPLLIGLREQGFRLLGKDLRFPFSRELRGTIGVVPDAVPRWAIVFSSIRTRCVDSSFASRYGFLVEIQRTNRLREEIILWRGQSRYRKQTFMRVHEQERVRAIARYLGIKYKERKVTIRSPRGNVIALNLNVSDKPSERTSFETRKIRFLIKALKDRGYRIRAIKNPHGDVREEFYRGLADNEIFPTPTFASARRIVREADFYLGADSGLAHYAVDNGKIAFVLFSRKHHGPSPLFQSTFRNQLCYFGDESFVKEVLRDIKRLEKRGADKELTNTINRFLQSGEGVHCDPYHNERKLLTLQLSLISQTDSCRRLAREIHAQSAGIFLSDEVVGVGYRKLKPFRGKLFVDTEGCARRLHKVILENKKAEKISLHIKPCSFFYGTAMRDGSSDVDLPTITSSKLRNSSSLMRKIFFTLRNFGFSMMLPHQTPVLKKNLGDLRKLLAPVVIKGKFAFSQAPQKDPQNFLKYSARLKIKLIAKEIDERKWSCIRKTLSKTRRGRKLNLELATLKRDAGCFEAWEAIIRKIIAATSTLGDFGAKGQIVMKISKGECRVVGRLIGGLMRHGVVYSVGTRLYPLWNIRRPQHGWFQPITLLLQDHSDFRNGLREGLKRNMPTPHAFVTLKKQLSGGLSQEQTLALLGSPEPLILIETFRYITLHKRFRQQSFARQEIRRYAREVDSNCNNALDKKLGLWSLAVGIPLPLTPKDIGDLTKYNCFVQCLLQPNDFDIADTQFFNSLRFSGLSANDFFGEFRARLIRLLREYFLYTMATGISREFLYEKRKEILFAYCVQGRALLEGPYPQARKTKRFLRSLRIMKTLSDGRALRETIQRNKITIPPRPTEPLLSWLLRHARMRMPKQGMRLAIIRLPSSPSLYPPPGNLET